MAAVLTQGVKLADWLAFGVHGVIAIMCSVHMSYHINTIKHFSPLTRLMHQKMLHHALAIQWLSMWGAFLEATGLFFYDRGDIVVSYAPQAINVLIYGILVHMLSVYLQQNLAWVESTWYTATVALLFLLGYSASPEMPHYALWAVGVAMLYWIFHILVVYRKDEKEGATLIVIVLFFWIFCSWTVSLVVQLVGHMGLMSIEFVTEVWLRNVSQFTSVSLPALVVAFHLSGYKTKIGMFIEVKGIKLLATRCSEHGFVGDYLFTHALLSAEEAAVVKHTDLLHGDAFVASLMGGAKAVDRHE